mgnify:CR=1 FL=1
MVIGVDSNRIFEAKIQSSDIKVWLVGYCDDNVVLFSNVIDKSTGTTGSWVDTNVSTDVSADATGVILKFINTLNNYYTGCNVRKNGSTDNRTGGIHGLAREDRVIGIDANKIFEQYIGNTSIDCKLVGYTKPPVTFFTNAIDKSLTATGTWTDIDLTSDTDPTADGAMWEISSGTSGAYKGEFRKNGSTDDRTSSAKIGAKIIHALVGLDSGNICEGWIDNTAVDFYLIGYCKPSVIIKSWAGSLNVSHTFKRPSRFIKLTQVLQLAHLFRRHRLMKFSQILQVLHQYTVSFGVILKQWTTTLQVTHTFRRPTRSIKLTQSLQVVHSFTLKRLFKFLQSLNAIHIFRRPKRKISYTQTLQTSHVFSRPIRIIKLSAVLQTMHLFSRPTRLIHWLQSVGLLHEYYVIKPGVKVTKLFLVLGNIAIQLTDN